MGIIKVDARKKFEVGDLVKRSSYGLSPQERKHLIEYGVVVGFSRNKQYVRVQKHGQRTAIPYSILFWTKLQIGEVVDSYHKDL